MSPRYWATLVRLSMRLAESILDLEDGYFRALREVIVEMEKGPVGHFPH